MTERKEPLDAAPPDLFGQLDAATAAKMLEGVFEEAGMEPNSVPMEALDSYSPSRKQRVDWRTIIAAIGVGAAVLAGLLTIKPQFTVVGMGLGENYLPVYQIEVGGILPVRTVRARLDGVPISVVETGEKTYAVEADANGQLSVEVTLTNDKSGTVELTVSDFDAEAPTMVSNEVDDDVRLYVRDAGAGVNYEGIFALTESGERVYPTSFDEEQGLVVFAFPSEDLDVYIPDKLGNTLHLAMELMQ